MNFFASAFSETHARWFRLSVAPIFLITLLALVLLSSGCSDDSEGGDINFPTAPPEDEMNWVFDVYGTAADDIYACGNKGAMFHYDGTSWSYVDMGTGSPITTVWATDTGTMYAAGHNGKIWQESGGSWSSMSSGTSEDLYGLGAFDQVIHAVGKNGTIKRLSGGSWSSVENVVILRDPESLAPQDTLNLLLDFPSIITVSEYFLGGAYNIPDFEGDMTGVAGTDGMVLAVDEEPELYDWRLRPVGTDQFAVAEWITSASSSIVNIDDNYLGTSEGWIFHISEDINGKLVIEQMDPDITTDSGSGIRDMWLDEDRNLFFVTDDGEMGFQSSDYNFSEEIGFRAIFPVTHSGLTSIWGSDREHIYMTGFTENSLIEASVALTDTTAALVFNVVPLEFPNKGGQSIDMFEDHVGMPRF